MWIRISVSARFERCVACDSNRPLLALRSRGARSFDVASSASATVWSTLEADFALALSPTHLLSCAGRRTGGLTDFLARQRALSAVATAPTSAATRDDESTTISESITESIVSRLVLAEGARPGAHPGGDHHLRREARSARCGS